MILVDYVHVNKLSLLPTFFYSTSTFDNPTKLSKTVT